MRVAIIGGKLQGIEAVILSRIAGIHSVLIDINPKAPASTLCDTFVCGDICRRESKIIEALKQVDFILPAMENWDVINAVLDIAKENNIPIAFDLEAYKVSSSKIKSDLKMDEFGILKPRYYPEGKFPYIMKPSGESGSAGVKKILNEEELDCCLSKNNASEWIVEEFVEGPSYSIEIIGEKDNYKVFEPTEIHMADDYDCCKVTVPVPLSNAKKEKLYNVGLQLANMVNLKGIMDVEVIEGNGEFYVLEIDARIPSQTPLAVYYSTGENELEILAKYTLDKSLTPSSTAVVENKQFRYVSYEQYTVVSGTLFNSGEHIISDVYPLTIKEDFLGAKLVISNWDYVGRPDSTANFAGIFILVSEDLEGLNLKRNDLINKLKRQFLCK
ncbi:MAG: 3-methylornithine--L-lysine ligase PylC [Peptostreptococcaceae bacterium]|nr:3-methylornithine--L-lysine ligase PylC [Peptostreptococcaceae bacterium]MDY5738641.1 3-methylornithine--L-lysine ligase PylC [Anaerovoracaceae bacterium]